MISCQNNNICVCSNGPVTGPRCTLLAVSEVEKQKTIIAVKQRYSWKCLNSLSGKRPQLNACATHLSNEYTKERLAGEPRALWAAWWPKVCLRQLHHTLNSCATPRAGVYWSVWDFIILKKKKLQRIRCHFTNEDTRLTRKIQLTDVITA